MKVAFLFPGQGSQVLGMGKDIYEKYEEAKKIYNKANEVLKINTQNLCFNSDEETLKKTENTQIAIALTSLAILTILNNKGIKPEIATGLSLGEYVALTSAQYINFEKCMELLQKRGYFMGNYIPNEEYAMMAVIGLESSKIEEVCRDITKKNIGFIAPSNYNYSEQTVISGNKDAIEKAENILKQAGAKKVVLLKTGGPFHTQKLEKAREEFEKVLNNVEFNKQGNGVKVIKNIDGQYYKQTDNFANILSKHIVSPVRFDKAIKKMQEEGIDTFVEIGPGKTMTGFIKKELKGLEITCHNIQDVESLENFLGKYK